MGSTKKQIPKFHSEEEERGFWAEHDSTDFIDWQTAQRRRFPNLKPSLRTISLRLPVAMIEDLKVLANKRDIPYVIKGLAESSRLTNLFRRVPGLRLLR